MQIICGPEHDRRLLTFDLPPYQKIGVFVSGGVDSTLLYYLACAENIKQHSNHKIVPIIIHRREGSRMHARPVVDAVNQLFDLKTAPLRLGNTTLPEPAQVKHAVVQAFTLPPYFEAVYVGVITNRPEHMIGFDKIEIEQHERVFMPFTNLEKSHIIDIYYQLKIEHLLSLTFSCDQSELTPCGSCNGCRERQWGFDQIHQMDPNHA